MKLSCKIFYIGFFIYYSVVNVSAQQNDRRFFEAEYSVGKVVPNYTPNFPSSTVQNSVMLSLGVVNGDSTSWGKYYNTPETGVSLFLSNLGNDKIYGNQISVLPFIRFKVINSNKPIYIKLGLGLSYFTTHFDSLNNIGNVAIGSSFTWAFQAMLYKTIYQNKSFNLKLLGGYSHHSNGHTQIPNFGLNSALFGVSAQWNNFEHKEINTHVLSNSNQNVAEKRYFLNLREGVGFHELGGTSTPVGGQKKMVYTTALSVGILFKNHIKWKSGFAYRYYEHYYEFSRINNLKGSDNNLTQMASNVYFFTGIEFLMNHFSIDVEGGLNLYKPFYKEFNDEFQQDKELSYNLKKWFNARMGMNYYFANTIKTPTNNLFIGAHINANFGQADFTEFSLGYVYSF